jgi:hypothetical protein
LGSNPLLVITALIKAVELTLVWLSITLVSPSLDAAWKPINPVVIDVCVGLGTAFLLEVLTVVLTDRTRISISWRKGKNPKPVSEIAVDASDLLAEQPLYHVSTSNKSVGWVSRLVLRHLIKQGASLIVSVPGSPVFMTVERSYRPNQVKEIVEEPSSGGIRVLLLRYSTARTWSWAKVRLGASDAPVNDEWDIHFEVEGALAPRWCAKMVRIQSSVKSVSIYS